MSEARIVVDGVWKKFRRGQRHDSLRDLVPDMARAMFRPRKPENLTTDEFWVLKDLNFDVKPGEAVGIIGVNGAGKSTTLKLLTRILRPTLGRTTVSGRVGALIEVAAGFHPDLTGRENVYLQGAIMGLRRHEIERHFEEIVEFSGVRDFIDTQVKRFSSGMNARLGFSIAAFLEPDTLLIDEVLAVGDLAFQQKCYDRLKSFKASGVAVAFVSHSMHAVSLLCDRVVLLTPNNPALVTDPTSAVAAYLNASTGDKGTGATVEAARLYSERTGEEITGPVEPGDRLVADFTVRPSRDLPRLCIYARVVRADGLTVFDARSDVEGLAPQNLKPGQCLRAKIGFRANLGKGLYYVTAKLIDATGSWPGIECGTVGTFSVDNRKRHATIAELEPAFEFVQPTGEPTARVAR